MLKSKFILSLFRLFLLGSTVALFSGCAAILVGGASAGGVAYVMGEMKADVDASTAELSKAIKEGCDQLKLVRISGAGDDLTGKFVYRTADDRKVTLKYERITDDTSKLRIRVGLIGDQVLSQKIFDAIQEELR